MQIDNYDVFSNAQVLTATAASTDSLNFGSVRRMGRGEPMAVVVVANTTMTGTSPTIAITIQTDDNSAFSTPATALTSATLTALTAGQRVVLPLPYTDEQHMRLNYTMGGTTPNVTVTSFLQPMSMIDANEVTYAAGYTIQ